MLKLFSRRRLFYAAPCTLLMTVCSSLPSEAAIVIPTNFGQGADAEVREDDDNHLRFNLDPAWGPLFIPRGRNRGGINGSTQQNPANDLSPGDAGGIELATRVKDSTNDGLPIPPATGSPQGNDRTAAMYLKFDISDLTAQDLADHASVGLRLRVRNANNLNWSRLYALKPYYGPNMNNQSNTNPDWVAFRADINNWERAKFNLQGLKPEAMDAADPRRFGNNDPNLPVPNYNWIENPSVNGDPFPEGGSNTGEPQSLDETTWDPIRSPTIGPIGPITWYNAPGITPDSRDIQGFNQDSGKWNWNSDLEQLGQFYFPDPPGPSGVVSTPPSSPVVGATTPDGGQRLAVGETIMYRDANGNLRDLIERAQAAGRDTITLVVSLDNNALMNLDPDGSGPLPAEQLQTTPGGFLNFNYLVISKEMDDQPTVPGMQLINDNSWDPDGGFDPDGAGPLTSLPAWGSPFSCEAVGNPGATNCPLGGGALTRGLNDNGRFSPSLIFRVPEPSSVMLLGMGLVSTLLSVRRRK